MYLHKDDLEDILEFMNKFDCDVVEVESDTSSGIGSITTARLHGVKINGETVTVSRVITDESSW